MTHTANDYQREIQVISPSMNDLPHLFSKLRKILQKKSIDDVEIDSDTVQCMQSIVDKLNATCQRNPVIKIFPFLHEISKIYIRDLLSNTNALHILSCAGFQQIYSSVNSVPIQNDLNELFKQDHEFARTTFYNTWELLTLPIVTDFIHSKSPPEIFGHLYFILSVILARLQNSAIQIEFKSTDLSDQKQSIILLLNYVDEKKENRENSSINQLVNLILNLIWTIDDETITIPKLLEINCHTYFLKWIGLTNLSMEILQPVLHVLHNIARHDQGVVALNNSNCLSILQEFKQKILDPNKENQNELYVDLRFIYYMTLSYLIEPKENREEINNIRKMLDRLTQLLIDAGQADNNKFEGFHVSEPLVVLTKLFIHDEILKYVLNESPVVGLQAKTKIEFFCNLLIKFRGALAGTNDLNQLTLTALLNLIWSVSFHDEYVAELKSSRVFLITIKSLANDDGSTWVEQYVPKHMSTVPKAANGILWNLDENNPARTIKTTITPASAVIENDAKAKEKGPEKIQVMVSYCHADKNICHQIVDGLQKESRFQIWVDFIYCHSEDLWEEIGNAIEKADVVLFLMSKDYQDSKSCRQEVMYAKDSLKKRFIPIYTKKDFAATGWLGVRIVGPQYIRFGKKSFDDTIKELIKLIASDKKEEQLIEVPKETKPPPVPIPSEENKPSEPNDESIKDIEPPNKPIKEWTKKDINLWFDNNHIQRELANLYNFQHGTELLLYSQCLRPNWQIEYADIRKRYEQKYQTQLYREEFVRLVGAIDRLQSSSVSHTKTCVIS